MRGECAPFYLILSVYAHSFFGHTYFVWQKVCQEWDNKAMVDSSGKKVKQKQAMLKTWKSISSSKHFSSTSDNNGDDDFMPTKKVAAAKAWKPIGTQHRLLACKTQTQGIR